MIRHVISLYLYSLSQPPCYLQILKTQRWKPMNGHSSTAQYNVITHYHVSWYMAGFPKAIKWNNTVPGLLIKRRRDSRCTGSGEKKHFFEVLATEAFNKSTFYCTANERRRQYSCSCGTEGRCYSRPALLTGEHVMFVFL